LSENNYREMYVSEALEHVESINQTLLKLEENPEKKDYVDVIFRSAHTIKGMASTMGYDSTRELCKNIENIFDNIRSGKDKLTPPLVTSLLSCVDILEKMISDENFKIDLEPYLRKLVNPDENILSITKPTSSTKSPTIRVKMTDLDSLVNLVGELVISKMRLRRASEIGGAEETKEVIMEIDRLINDLQYQSMKVRLVPVEQVFGRFRRLVRDTSQKLNKKVQLEMNGSNIELDRSVLDSITDPLLHILRNCVDHGLEFPDERLKMNKPETGLIKINAQRKGEDVQIIVSDDGNGIDLKKLTKKAIEKGIISSDESEKMTKDEILLLLGTPGLSTAKEVTDVSGRGVGMDVVISQVESVGGNVKIESEHGKGTTITLSLPLNVSIIKGLLVGISNQRFILPLSNISITVKIPQKNIEKIHNSNVIRLQGKIIPLIKLNHLFEIPEEALSDSESVTVIVVDRDGKKYGLIVDYFERNQETVIKKLDQNISSDIFTNATILPDGNIALVLDPTLILQ